MGHLPRRFNLHDEIYQIKTFSRSNVRVLMRLDPSKIDLSKQGVRRKDNDFAVIWARRYGRGRVLYNGLGHREEVWERPDIQRMWQDMVLWAMGDLPGDASPRPAPAQ
jgi:type 1 glutamine amidotransferase